MTRIRNDYISGSVRVGGFGDKRREARLRWFGQGGMGGMGAAWGEDEWAATAVLILTANFDILIYSLNEIS